MLRTRRRSGATPVRTPAASQPADRLVLTDADRALAALGPALMRTSRWQGNAG